MKPRPGHTVRDFRDAIEALLLLAAARPMCRSMSLDRLEGLLPTVRKPGDPGSIDAVRIAVDRASARLPGGASCFPRAMTAAIMLRRRGVAATIDFGLALTPERLAGHVVARVNDHAVVGGAEADEFATVRRLGQKNPRDRSQEETFR